MSCSISRNFLSPVQPFWRALLLLLLTQTAWSVDMPQALTVPSDFKEDAKRRIYWDFDTAEFPFTAPGDKNVTHQKVEGHLWQIAVSWPANPKAGPDVVIAQLATELEKDGWTSLRRQGLLVAKKIADSGEFWLSGYGNGGYFSFTVMTASPPSRGLVLAPPQKEVEKLDDAKDFPFVLPMPGSKLKKTMHDARPFEIVLPGSATATYVIPKATKWYQEPAGVSSYEFVAVYRQALEAAGWEVVRGKVGGDAVVIAHYGKDGRDIWLSTRADRVEQSIAIADNGAESQESALQKQLREKGHVALYGIYFDTDIATPRPESGPTLQNVLELLQNDSKLHLEVQGHTDSTGSVEHNEKLSDARAASVRQWLVDHGVEAGRLDSKGYAATQPVADNNTPEGRAKNRRVEIKNR